MAKKKTETKKITELQALDIIDEELNALYLEKGISSPDKVDNALLQLEDFIKKINNLKSLVETKKNNAQFDLSRAKTLQEKDQLKGTVAAYLDLLIMLDFE